MRRPSPRAATSTLLALSKPTLRSMANQKAPRRIGGHGDRGDLERCLSWLGGLPSNPLPLWMMLATRIMRAVADGERDPQRIKRFALDGLNDYDGFGEWRRP